MHLSCDPILPFCPRQELGDALHLLNSKASDDAASAASDRRRLEGVVKSLEGRLGQVGGAGQGSAVLQRQLAACRWAGSSGGRVGRAAGAPPLDSRTLQYLTPTGVSIHPLLAQVLILEL